MKKVIVFIIFCSGLLGEQVYSQGSANVMDAPPLDGAYKKERDIERKPIPYQYVREADVQWAWRIWRIMDLREKINHVFYYPLQKANGRKSFMYTVIDAIKEGSITVYEIDLVNDEFLKPITWETLEKDLNKIDTMEFTRPDPPYDTYDSVVRIDFSPSDVKLIRVKEDWFFDKSRSVMDVRIIGLCPVLEQYDKDGSYKGLKPLFWIYFPEARPIFAKNEVFNRANDAERRTYDDIFFKRLFGSYIYKEQNEFDRKISQYASGINALLEAERIKDKIFNYEHDLWEY